MLQPFLGPLFNFFNRFFNGIGFSCYTLRNIRFRDGKSCFPVNIRQAEKQDNTVNSKAGGKIMVRGVNRKIIEINNVEGGYFEKVLFFVKDDKRSSPDDLLEGQASKYIAEGCTLKYRTRLSLTAILSLCVKILTVAGFGFSAAVLFH